MTENAPAAFFDLYCSCGARYGDRGGEVRTKDSARAAGWHIYDGPSVTGQELHLRLCDQCVDKGKPQRPNKNVVLEGQQDLFDVTPIPVGKRKKGREMS